MMTERPTIINRSSIQQFKIFLGVLSRGNGAETANVFEPSRTDPFCIRSTIDAPFGVGLRSSIQFLSCSRRCCS